MFGGYADIGVAAAMPRRKICRVGRLLPLVVWGFPLRRLGI